MAARILLIAVLCLPTLTHAAGQISLDRGSNPQQCAQISMRADYADCDALRCHLAGHAELTCDAIFLSADTIDIFMTAERAFNGAVAAGHGLLVDGLKVVTCERITLHADRVQGTVDSATLEVRKNAGPRNAEGVPQGRNQAVLHGNIERLDRDRLMLHGGDLTLCDCGPNEAPSWRFDGAEIEAELGERVTIWWPQVRINLLGLGLIPITPPLAPLSLPLKPRAAGFLLPELQLLGGGWPTLDVPFFIPLGDSWDLKLAAGMRTDWGTGAAHPFGIHSVGAPRLGARVRYAPSEQTTGVFNFQLTRDGAHAMADHLLALDLKNKADVSSPAYNLLYQRRRALVNRVSLDLKHRTHLSNGIDFVADARWVSDDLVNTDFLLALDERFAAYLPSRAELVWRTAGATVLVAADAMVRLDSVALTPGSTPGAQPVLGPVFSNIGGEENGTMHRGPYIAVQSLPIALGGGVHVDGALSYVRYGTWTHQTPHNSPFSTDPQLTGQNIVDATAGLGFHRTVGLVNLAARAGLDSALIGHEEIRTTTLDTAVLLAADADIRLAGRHGDTLHVMTPRVAYRALPLHLAPPLKGSGGLLDERLQRHVGHQGMVVLQQSLWQGAPQTVSIGSLDIGQPWDLVTGQMLQPWLKLRWTTLEAGSGSVWMSLDPRALAKVPEFSADWLYDSAAFGLLAQYKRFAPDADRFQRSMYELAAPRLPLPAVAPLPAGAPVDSLWAHTVRAGGTLRWAGFLDATYTATVQLPRPGQRGGEPACLNKRDWNKMPRPQAPDLCVTQHVLAINYTSPCDCWGINAALSAVPQDIPDSLRFQIFFNIAGYRLGGANQPR